MTLRKTTPQEVQQDQKALDLQLRGPLDDEGMVVGTWDDERRGSLPHPPIVHPLIFAFSPVPAVGLNGEFLLSKAISWPSSLDLMFISDQVKNAVDHQRVIIPWSSRPNRLDWRLAVSTEMTRSPEVEGEDLRTAFLHGKGEDIGRLISVQILPIQRWI